MLFEQLDRHDAGRGLLNSGPHLARFDVDAEAVAIEVLFQEDAGRHFGFPLVQHGYGAFFSVPPARPNLSHL